MSWEDWIPSLITMASGLILYLLNKTSERKKQREADEDEATAARIVDNTTLRNELWTRIRELEKEKTTDGDVIQSLRRQLLECERQLRREMTGQVRVGKQPKKEDSDDVS